MTFEQAASVAQLLLVPMVGLLWRISTQLAALVARVDGHGERLQALEGKRV